MKQLPFVRIRVPNPYFESDVNAWLIPGGPITLIDTGVRTAEAKELLLAGLSKAGVPVQKIEQIILTHKHPDHMGLANTLHRLSGASVYAHREDATAIREYDMLRPKFLQQMKADLLRWGVPEAGLESLLRPMEVGAGMGEACKATDLDDGQDVQTGEGYLKVRHTPGHTQGSICLNLGRYWFTGDHLLSEYTPNVGTGEFGSSGMLDKFLQSLQMLSEAMDQDSIALPGHGPPLDRPRERIEEILEHHRWRSEVIERALCEDHPLTVFEIARQIFGNLSGIHILLGASEVDAHLESLVSRGRALKEGEEYLKKQ